MNFDALQSTLRNGFLLAAQGMNRDVIYTDQNAPRADLPYIGMGMPRLVRETSTERYETAYDSDLRQIEQGTRHHYGVYVDLVVYRDTDNASAMNDAWRLQRSILRDDVLQAFDPAALVDTTEITDVATLLAPRIEPRAEFTVRFRIATDDVLVLPTIEQVEITPEFRHAGT